MDLEPFVGSLVLEHGLGCHARSVETYNDKPYIFPSFTNLLALLLPGLVTAKLTGL